RTGAPRGPRAPPATAGRCRGPWPRRPPGRTAHPPRARHHTPRGHVAPSRDGPHEIRGCVRVAGYTHRRAYRPHTLGGRRAARGGQRGPPAGARVRTFAAAGVEVRRVLERRRLPRGPPPLA